MCCFVVFVCCPEFLGFFWSPYRVNPTGHLSFSSDVSLRTYVRSGLHSLSVAGIVPEDRLGARVLLILFYFLVPEHRFASVGVTILLVRWTDTVSIPEIDNYFAPGEANQTYFKISLNLYLKSNRSL